MPDRQSRVSKEDDVAQSRANQWKIEGVGEKSNLADKQSPLGRERQDGNPDNAQDNGQHAADAKLSATANQFEVSSSTIFQQNVNGRCALFDFCNHIKSCVHWQQGGCC